MRLSPYCNLALLCIAILLVGQATPLLNTSGTSSVHPTIGLDNGHSNLHVLPNETTAFTNTLSDAGASILTSSSLLNRSFLNSISLLLISAPMENYSQTELGILDDWYASGGALWLSASPDNMLALQNLNSILSSLNSSLRVDYTYLTDPLFNMNGTPADNERVLVPLVNHQGDPFEILTSNVRTLYSFRPVPIIKCAQTSCSRLSLEFGTNWLAATASTVEAHNLTTVTLLPPSVRNNSNFPTVVFESDGAAKLLLTSSPIFSSWHDLFGYNPIEPHDNRVLVGNLLHWLANLSISTELEEGLPLIEGTSKMTILIDTAANNRYLEPYQLAPLASLLSGMGFTPTSLPTYDLSTLNSSSVLIMQAPGSYPEVNEVTNIHNWFKAGNRTLLMSSTADYTTEIRSTASDELNGILSVLGSSLRFEPGSLYDYETNIAGNPYLPLAGVFNRASPSITDGIRDVRSLSLQFSTILSGWNGTGNVPLETNLAALKNVTWISRSSNNSAILDLDKSIPLLSHKSGEEGSYITAAEEHLASNNRIILVAGPIFSGFSLLLHYPTAYGYPVDNLVFLRNLFTTVLHKTQIKTNLQAVASPDAVNKGGFVSFRVGYFYQQMSLSNLSKIDEIPVSPANVAVISGGESVQLVKLTNGTQTGQIGPIAEAGATCPSSQFGVPWNASASAGGYANKSFTGCVKLNFGPDLSRYVLGIPVVVFIAMAIYAVGRKAR